MWIVAIGGLIVLWALAQQRGVSLQQEAGSIFSDLSGQLGAAGGGLGLPTYSKIGPNSDPRTWYQGQKPGTVTVAGQKQNVQEWGAPDALAKKIAALTGTGAGVAGSIGGLAGGAGFAGTAAATAFIGVGIGAAVVGVVLGMISAHHQQALAAEGRALNDADARMVQAYALILQAVLQGEITDLSTARQHADQIVQDWYGEVRPVRRGTWHYTGQDMSADYQKVWIGRFQPKQGAPGFSDYHAPDPCNGACVVGHFFTERNELLVLAAVSDALNGNHNVLILPAIPPHQTQSGMPEVRVVY